jgi:hypothetical protein
MQQFFYDQRAVINRKFIFIFICLLTFFDSTFSQVKNKGQLPIPVIYAG